MSITMIAQQDQLREIRSVVAATKNFTTMVVVGIGGSSLGLRAFVTALGPRKNLVICDDLDPITFQTATRNIDWKNAVINIVSKSGGTLEIMAVASVLISSLQKTVGKDWVRHVVVTTDPETGFLRKWAQQHQLQTCRIPSDVGGRFSVFTSVGLLPLCWAGYDGDAIIAGAQSALTDPAPQKLAEQHVQWDRDGRSIAVIMPYSSHLLDYARWFVQLWAESLGKRGVGQTPMVAIGTSDQHAQLQLFAEGPLNKCIRFIKIEKWDQDVVVTQPIDPLDLLLKGKSFGDLLSSAADATAEALEQVGCPSYMLALPKLDEFTLAHLMMSDILMTLAAAKLYGVDPFGQPGVERTKKLWRQRLSA